MTELLNFPDGTVQHAYLTTDNAGDDLEIAVLDGDFVLLDTNENPVFRWDASESRWDFESQDVVGVGSFATESAAIGTVSGQGDVSRLIDRRTPGSDTGQIQFTGLSDDVEYTVFYSSQVGTTGSDIICRLNGDGASTGNYEYWDASGTNQASQNEMLLVSLTNSAAFSRLLTVTTVGFDGTFRAGFNNRLIGSRPRIDDFGREGGRPGAIENLNSIELIAADDFTGGDTVVELWERDYSA